MNPTQNSSVSYIETTEQRRLNEAREKGIPWKKWGPYLSERQWGTVREDYSRDASAVIPCSTIGVLAIDFLAIIPLHRPHADDER